MAQYNPRINLIQETFPLLSIDKGRSVLVSTFKNFPSGEGSNDPQITYCHNVMPTSEGLLSVGYEQVIPAPTGGDVNTTFDDTRLIFGSLGNRVYMGITEDMLLYSLEVGDTIWRHNSHTIFTAGSLITTGTVNGVTYIYVEGTGGYKYDEATHSFVSVSFTGLALGSILGISASSGYLVAFNATAIAWSSTIDPLDFTPSSVTGAGGGNVSDLEGDILFVVPNSLGLLAYTAANVVAATFTGNKQYPFKFKSVDNSKGALGLDFVAYEANAADHFAYTKGGLQTVNSRKAENIAPAITDFLAGQRFEDFDEVTSTFSVTNLTTTMKKKVKLIASRYVIISYGITTFTHALVYDIAYQRLGKLKITHTDCFEYLDSQVEISKQSIAFLLNDGTVKILKLSVPSSNRIGVLMLGKYQYTRDRHLVLQKVLAETVESTDDFTFTDLVSLDGKNTTAVTATETVGKGYRSYALRASGINHSLLFVGEFNLSTISLLFSLGGRR